MTLRHRSLEAQVDSARFASDGPGCSAADQFWPRRRCARDPGVGHSLAKSSNQRLEGPSPAELAAPCAAYSAVPQAKRSWRAFLPPFWLGPDLHPPRLPVPGPPTPRRLRAGGWASRRVRSLSGARIRVRRAPPSVASSHLHRPRGARAPGRKRGERCTFSLRGTRVGRQRGVGA